MPFLKRNTRGRSLRDKIRTNVLYRFTSLAVRPCHIVASRTIPVGALGIEPSLRAPKARVLPVYYAPSLR